MKMIKLLLVDDEKPFVEAAGRRLALRGFRVEFAFSGEQALDQIQRDPLTKKPF